MDAEFLDALDAADEVDRQYDDYAVYRYPWLPLQLSFLLDPAKCKAARTGNQGLGKTTAGLAEDIFYALGDHPFLTVPPPPCRIAIICGTAVQSIEIQEKLWHLLPRAELEDGVEFRLGKGFRGRDPKMVPFKNGSLITFHTSYQDAIAVAGGTKDRIHFDEPPKSDRMFVEAKQRMFKTGGTLILTFAPVNAEVGYLRELIEKREISEHHSRMTSAAMTPMRRIGEVAALARRLAREHGGATPSPVDVDEAIGQLGAATSPLCDKHGRPFTDEYIAELKAGVPAYQIPVVFDGEWEFYVVKRVYDRYDPDVHAIPHDRFWAELATAGRRCEAAGTKLKLSLGVDHGDGTNKSEAALLTAVDDSGLYPRFFEVSEYVSDGSTTSDMDARAILSMLRVQGGGQRWSSLDFAVGDRTWKSSIKTKTNTDLAKAIALELGLDGWHDLEPSFLQAKAGSLAGHASVDAGIRFLHESMVRPGHYYVNRDTCPRLNEAFLKWDKKPSSPHVHVCDTARYSKLPWQAGLHGRSTVGVVRRGAG